MIDNPLKTIPPTPLENEWPSDDAAFKTNNQCILSMCNMGQILDTMLENRNTYFFWNNKKKTCSNILTLVASALRLAVNPILCHANFIVLTLAKA